MRPKTDDSALAKLVLASAHILDATFAPLNLSTIVRAYEENDLGMGEYEVVHETLFGDASSGVRLVRVECRSSDGAGPSVSSVRTTTIAHGLVHNRMLQLVVRHRPEPFHNAGLAIAISGIASDVASMNDTTACLRAHFFA